MCKHFGLEDRGHEVRTNFAEQSIDCLHARCCFTMWWLFTFFERVSSFEVFGGPHEGDFPTYSHSVWIYSISVKSCQSHRLFQNIPYDSLLDLRSIYYVPLLARDACPSSRSLMKQTVHTAFNTFQYNISHLLESYGRLTWMMLFCLSLGRSCHPVLAVQAGVAQREGHMHWFLACMRSCLCSFLLHLWFGLTISFASFPSLADIQSLPLDIRALGARCTGLLERLSGKRRPRPGGQFQNVLQLAVFSLFVCSAAGSFWSLKVLEALQLSVAFAQECETL